MKRRFSDKERMALYLIADGICQQCGDPLDDNWEADHMIPYGKGGDTDVINGQALCSDCNRKKGSKSMFSFDALRGWQRSAFREFEKSTKENFLVVATPGAGKTFFSLSVAAALIQQGRIDKVIIVCPTTHLKKQWSDKAHEMGMNLDPNWTNDRSGITRDFHGVCVTYQQVANEVGIAKIRYECSRHRVLVILDEIHHAGESKSWGDGLIEALEKAIRKLALSGTPFRPDNNPIPFVDYTSDGRSIADFTYSYAHALHDEVCRPVYFPTYEGHLEWMSHTGDFMEAGFRVELNKRQASERLNTALNPKGRWMSEVLRAANDQLDELRKYGHEKAAGLIITKDKWHADQVAGALKQVTGETAIVVTSDDPKASESIEKFRASSSKWIIAIKMVSEGVDIPRLRVLVYATNVTSELFFRQAVGRIVRVMPDLDEQCAYFYIPRDENLMAIAESIKEEREHQLDLNFIEKVKRVMDESGDYVAQQSFFMPITSEAIKDDTIIDREHYAPEEIEAARLLLQQFGGKSLGIPAETMAMIARQLRKDREERKEPNKPQPAMHQRKKDLSDAINTTVSRYVNVAHPRENPTKMHGLVHGAWKHNGGSDKKQKDMDIDELERKLSWITRVHNNHNQGNRTSIEELYHR